jgi:hypothetical protein
MDRRLALIERKAGREAFLYDKPCHLVASSSESQRFSLLSETTAEVIEAFFGGLAIGSLSIAESFLFADLFVMSQGCLGLCLKVNKQWVEA